MGAFLGQYLHYRERSGLLDELGGYWTFDGTITEEQSAEYLQLGGATAGLWKVLGIRPVEGRLFRNDDPWPEDGEGPGVTLLGHGYWTERYGGASAVGRSVTTQGWTYRIVGVLPPSLPLAPTRPAMWNAIPDARARANPQWTMPALVGRLAPGATAEDLERELAALSAELPQRYPGATTIRNTVQQGRMTPRVVSLREWVLGGVERTLSLLFVSVLGLLLVALANVGGLFLVRGDSARRELAVRLALGAGRRSLALRILVEGVFVVCAAALAGLLLAHAGVAAMVRTVPTGIPRIEAVAMGWPEVAFVLALALVCTGVITVVQLLHGRRNLEGALREGGRGAGPGSTRLRLRHAFVSLQVALALVLSVGAALVLQSARSLGRVDPGFPVEDLLTFRVPFPFSEIRAAGGRGARAHGHAVLRGARPTTRSPSGRRGRGLGVVRTAVEIL